MNVVVTDRGAASAPATAQLQAPAGPATVQASVAGVRTADGVNIFVAQ